MNPTNGTFEARAPKTGQVEAEGDAGRGGRVAAQTIAGTVVVACALWAFAPLQPAQVEAPALTAVEVEHAPLSQAPLDLAAFNVPLWVVPAAPPVAAAEPTPPPPPPPPPIRWQLLAIVREDSGYKALVYDPDTDKVLSLGRGDQSGPRRVVRVAATSVDVQDRAGVRTLALREPAPGGQP